MMHWPSYYAGRDAERRSRGRTVHHPGLGALREDRQQRVNDIVREKLRNTRDPRPPVNQREVLEGQRRAFRAGAQHIRDVYFLGTEVEQLQADERAAWERYPNPRQARVLRISHGPEIPGYATAWRYADGQFWSQDVQDGVAPKEHAWISRSQLPAAHFSLLADLKERPTEGV